MSKAQNLKTSRKEASPAPAGKSDDKTIYIRFDQQAEMKEIGGSNITVFNATMLAETLRTMWIVGTGDNEADKRAKHDGVAAAAAALRAFKPTDEIEGMLAAQATAMHFAAMECFRRAILPEQTADTASKLRKDGANLARGVTDMVEALDRKRGKGQQHIRVERVMVADGGQAIVGNVTTGTRTPPIASSQAAAQPRLEQGAAPMETETVVPVAVPAKRGEG